MHMDTKAIIQSLDKEISGLQQARDVLSRGVKTGRQMSIAGRRRIAAAQKKRWAKQKAA